MQIAQWCQSCIHQDRHMHYPNISELQKNFGGTPKQGSLKNQHFTAVVCKLPVLRHLFPVCLAGNSNLWRRTGMGVLSQFSSQNTARLKPEVGGVELAWEFYHSGVEPAWEFYHILAPRRLRGTFTWRTYWPVYFI